MNKIVPVVTGWAEGPTPIAAFDAALAVANVQDLNLVTLSSIVPPGHTVERMNPLDRSTRKPAEYGSLAYCVLAEHRETSGTTAAGLAWSVDRNGKGGVFLEAHGTSLEIVESELEVGITDLMNRRTFLEFEPPEFAFAAGSADGPSSAVVLALIETRPFNVGTG